jgi:hypothetical protein
MTGNKKRTPMRPELVALLDRLMQSDRYRELMREAMRRKQDQDPHVVTKLGIGLLRREIARFERQMELEDQETTAGS